MDSSHLHNPAPTSQTQLDQSELVQYECNLAACYEAEYLLSLKIQEEMCHQRDSYCDPSEVACLHTPGILDTTAIRACPQIPAGVSAYRHTDQRQTCTAMDCSANAAHNRMVVDNLYGFVDQSKAVQLRSMPSAACAPLQHGQKQLTFQNFISGQEGLLGGGQCMDIGGNISGGEEITHVDGPSRKRMCVNRADS